MRNTGQAGELSTGHSGTVPAAILFAAGKQFEELHGMGGT